MVEGERAIDLEPSADSFTETVASTRSWAIAFSSSHVLIGGLLALAQS